MQDLSTSRRESERSILGGTSKPVIPDEQRRWRLAHRHRLTPAGRTDDVAAITDDLVALHSSDPATVFLSALARMQRPTIDAIEQALYDDRSVVRHHAMRRTLWVMTPAIARLAHAAATLKIARAERRRTVKAIEETSDIADADAWLDAALGEIGELLDEQGPMSTRDLGAALPHLAVPIVMGATTKNPGSMNAHTKVLQGAGFDGELVRGAPTGTWNSAEYRWARASDWLASPIAGLDEASAAGELLGRWLWAFGPASDTDIRWWFGWTAALTNRALLALDAVEVELEGSESGWLRPDDVDDVEDPGPWVRLLPGLDPTTMGWKQRDWYLDPAQASYLFDRWGNGGPTIWADGRIVGAWIQRPDGRIITELTTVLPASRQQLLDEAIDELETAIAPTVVRPRFPAPAQKALLLAGRAS